MVTAVSPCPCAKPFNKGAGYTDEAVDRPVIGISNNGDAYSPCHGDAPQLIDAVEHDVMLLAACR